MNTTVIAAVVALIIGFGGGYVVTDKKTPTVGHEMSDGSTMSDAMADMTAALEGKTGDEFDKSFITEMITHHEGAVAMAEQALLQAKHTEIKKMAQDIIDAQTREITTMRGWLQSWYGSQQ